METINASTTETIINDWHAWLTKERYNHTGMRVTAFDLDRQTIEIELQSTPEEIARDITEALRRHVSTIQSGETVLD